MSESQQREKKEGDKRKIIFGPQFAPLTSAAVVVDERSPAMLARSSRALFSTEPRANRRTAGSRAEIVFSSFIMFFCNKKNGFLVEMIVLCVGWVPLPTAAGAMNVFVNIRECLSV